MNHENKSDGISRRKLLAATGGVGGIGLGVGVGTGAVLSDQELFEGVLVQSGKLQLDAEWHNPDNGSISGDKLTANVDPDDDDGSALLELSLPGSTNNPARVWLQPQCPETDKVASAEVAADLSLSIYYDESDDNKKRPVRDASGEEIVDESLLELAAEPGFQLRFDGDDCLGAEETGYLLFEWEYTDEFADYKSPPTFDLNIFARQCRNNETPQNPFPMGEVCEGGKAISWVAFCPEGDSDDLSRSHVEPFEVTGAVLELSDPPTADKIDAVILKYGPQIRVFDYSSEQDFFSTVEGGTVYEQDGNSYPESDGRTNSDPCPDSTDGGLKYQCNGSCTFEKEV